MLNALVCVCLSVRESGCLQGRVAQQQLNVLLDKYLLRRTKEGTLKDQLPCKTDNIVLCPMSELQLRAYRWTPPPPPPNNLTHTHCHVSQQARKLI